jgi:hypothetical protein
LSSLSTSHASIFRQMLHLGYIVPLTKIFFKNITNLLHLTCILQINQNLLLFFS